MYAFNLQIEPVEFEAELEGEVNRKSRDYIKWVQQSLNQIMGLKLAVDGTTGAQTRSAIRSFQQQKGLKADGVVGSSTEAALKAALGRSQPGTTRVAAPQPSTGQRPRFAGQRTLRLRLKPQLVRQPQAPDQSESDLVNCSKPVIFDRFELGDYRLRPHHYEQLPQCG